MTQLINRFKEFRREKKVRQDTKPGPKKMASPKRPGITLSLPSIEVSAGEDEFSFTQHNKCIQSEYKKRHPNKVVVRDIMDRSFAM